MVRGQTHPLHHLPKKNRSLGKRVRNFLTLPLDPGRLDGESVPVSFLCLGCGQGLLSGAFA